MLTQDFPLLTPAPEDRQALQGRWAQPLRPETEYMLRDIAYVLQLTRRVRTEMEEKS
jgi:hypothetical protein